MTRLVRKGWIQGPQVYELGFFVDVLVVKPFSEKNLDILTVSAVSALLTAVDDHCQYHCCVTEPIGHHLCEYVLHQIIRRYSHFPPFRQRIELKTYNGKDLLFSSSFSKYNFYNKIFILLNKIDEIYKVIEKLKNNYIYVFSLLFAEYSRMFEPITVLAIWTSLSTSLIELQPMPVPSRPYVVCLVREWL